MGFIKTTTATITDGLSKNDAKLFMASLKTFWNGLPDSFVPSVAKALDLIGVKEYRINSNVANGIVSKMEKKAKIFL